MEFLPKLSQNLLEILDDEEYYDITIEVGNDPNIILRYIYGGKLSVEKYDIPDLLKILVTANELNLQELSNYLQSFLVKNNASWIEQNFNLVYQTSFETDSFPELQKYCNTIISKKPDKIFKSFDFSLIPEKVLISIIQSDDLRMGEIRVWEHVLKWGIAQNSELPSDFANFSKNDFNILKNTIQKCIPFIRFYNLTSKEFSDKVIPCRKVLPKELYMDLLKTFLNLHPGSRPNGKLKLRNNVGSKIITSQHIELISKWIDKLDVTDELSSSYEFKLLLCGSRDGFSIKKFHEKCDNKSHTVIIAKVKNSNKILGGYNPVEWKSTDGYSSTKDSFIFSFEDSINIENYILSRVKNEGYAIWNGQNYGPYFGNDDLVMNVSDKSFCKKGSYEIPIRETADKFSVEEYEVFQITKD
ncbi:carbohydrate-binding module family 13 protein [Rhizophagus clarus]|uniref:Carbohydrate-binding module family 13 protein n=1 Tax=Rhizophagus clarus TaxID=94130 RepID=A0A8H3L8D9_9GLOM|nr:carbohydrate-binding module family 13 protein [Rhizophagus clarus]